MRHFDLTQGGRRQTGYCGICKAIDGTADGLYCAGCQRRRWSELRSRAIIRLANWAGRFLRGHEIFCCGARACHVCGEDAPLRWVEAHWLCKAHQPSQAVEKNALRNEQRRRSREAARLILGVINEVRR